MQMQAGSKRWVPSHTHPLFEASGIEKRLGYAPSLTSGFNVLQYLSSFL